MLSLFYQSTEYVPTLLRKCLLGVHLLTWRIDSLIVWVVYLSKVTYIDVKDVNRARRYLCSDDITTR